MMGTYFKMGTYKMQVIHKFVLVIHSVSRTGQLLMQKYMRLGAICAENDAKFCFKIDN
jgi:hypothetical protein